ncbi:hypothetical protein GW17_00052275 [Ensete ventricosum]|nr:hypothetical protein GW17_00052275 [Ensete ventricosum]
MPNHPKNNIFSQIKQTYKIDLMKLLIKVTLSNYNHKEHDEAKEGARGGILSFPPRSSVAWTKRAWRLLVHSILGDLVLRFVGNLCVTLDLIRFRDASADPTPRGWWWDDNLPQAMSGASDMSSSGLHPAKAFGNFLPATVVLETCWPQKRTWCRCVL